MNESKELIGKETKTRTQILKQNLKLKVKVNKNIISKKQKRNKYIALGLGTLSFIILCVMLISKLKNFKKKNKSKEENSSSSTTKTLSKIEKIYKSLETYEGNYTSYECNKLDPINIFKKRLNSTPVTVCSNSKSNSNHICYKDGNPIFVAQNGASCEFKNVIIDPSKWSGDGKTYKGPMDPSNRGCPLLSKGFFNVNCEDGLMTNYSGYDFIYNNYFNGWDYNSESYENEKNTLEELAPGKTVFFISRNQDSPNLYHGGSEFVNALSIMYLLNLDPEKIQIVFLESILINDDPFYDLYKNLIGRGGEPIHVRNLTKKYMVSNGVHIPIDWDSPCFITSHPPNCANNPTKTYYLYNKLIDLFMPPENFIDSFDKKNQEVYYYPESIINTGTNDKNSFNKILTFQWRRVWPKGRSGQQRILGNGPELADKISTLLPKNILLRLIDTASLPIREQIAIMRQTDYFVGIHGAGLSLIIYAPKNCIYHEVLHSPNMNGLELFAATSGHKVYKDIIDSDVRDVDGNENIFFNVNEFANRVIEHLKESNLI